MPDNDGIRDDALKTDLVPGKRYRIDFEDCCVEGTIEDVTFERYENDECGWGIALVFDRARLSVTRWSVVEAFPDEKEV